MKTSALPAVAPVADDAALPKAAFDAWPLALVAVLMLLAWPLSLSPRSKGSKRS